ncbi:MAG: carbohydrate ABC transporter permease [Acidimicrobiales bacterium]
MNDRQYALRHHPVRSRGISRLAAYVVLTIAAIVALFPVWWIIATALETTARAYSFPGALVPQGVLGNVLDAWSQAPWERLLLNSLLIGGATTIGTLLVAFLAAYALVYLFSSRTSRILFTLVVMTMLVPFYAVLIPDYVIIRDLNLLNTYLAQILPFVGGGFAIFLLRQFVYAFPKELRDAARTDGMGDWGFMWHILFPNLRPAMVTVGIYTFILSWNAFLWPLIVTNDSSVQPVQVGLANLLTTANGTDFTMLSAAAGITALPVIILYLIFQRQVTDSVNRSGLKG